MERKEESSMFTVNPESTFSAIRFVVRLQRESMNIDRLIAVVWVC